MKRSHLIITIILAIFIGFRLVALSQDHNQHHPKQEKQNMMLQDESNALYACPMHPEITSDKPGKCPKCGMNLEKKSSSHQQMSDMMGKPTFEQSVQGTTVQVWLMTREEHMKMMAGHAKMDEHMNYDMNDDEMKAMMAGTHHVMVMTANIGTNMVTDSTSIRIAMTSPSNNSSVVELKNMVNHFGGGLTLDEKGTYKLDVWVSDKGLTRTVSFSYQVK